MRCAVRSLSALVLVGALALGTGCSAGSGDDDSASDDLTTVEVDDGAALDDVVLPGQQSPATSPATTVPPVRGGSTSSTTTTVAPSASSTPSSTTSTTTTAAGSTSSTSTTTTTSTTAPAAGATRFGPTVFVDDGAVQSTFTWELDVIQPSGGDQTSSVAWLINGDSEDVSFDDDGDDSVIRRVGSEYWRSDTSGTLRAVNSDEYREERQNILDEVLNTDPGAAVEPSSIDGAGLYRIRTSDLATISEVFGGEPTPGADAVLIGEVEIDAAMRVTYWSLEYTADAVGGLVSYLLEGEARPSVDAPIAAP